MRVLTCTYPFPDQEPAVEVSQACLACPYADRALLELHAAISSDDPELLLQIRSFIEWFFAEPREPAYIEEVTRYAADLYTRPDHSGTCVPKAVLFAVYKVRQYDSYVSTPHMTEAAEAAVGGDSVASWPDGEIRRTLGWSALFRWHSLRYE